jgi:ATP-dependent DNA helicase DinG
LIRSTTDVGVVVICDKRLTEKPYGKRIKRALPAAPLSRDMGDVVKFFEQHAVKTFAEQEAL